jgi:hypothetical protein
VWADLCTLLGTLSFLNKSITVLVGEERHSFHLDEELCTPHGNIFTDRSPIPSPPQQHESLGPERPSIPPAQPTDFPYQIVPFDPLRVSPVLRSGPSNPPTGPPPPPTPPPGLLTDPLTLPPREPDPEEVGLLKLASAAGSLQDVHRSYCNISRPRPQTLTLQLAGPGSIYC